MDALRTRYGRRREREDHDGRISFYAQALELCLAGHLLHEPSLNKLGTAVSGRFACYGEAGDLVLLLPNRTQGECQ